MMTLASLLAGCFLAATILPFSSEIMLAAALQSGGFPAWVPITVATLGNTLGAVVNWGLGRYVLHWQDRRWFPVSPQQLDRASDRFARFGLWSLLLSWVPLVGDPLTMAAGVLQIRLAVFLPLVAVGKALRYAAIGWVAG